MSRILSLRMAAPVALLLAWSAAAPCDETGRRPMSSAELRAIQQRADQLVSDLEYLLEDVRIDLDGRSQQKILQQANQAMRSVAHFQRALRPDIGRDHVAKDFQEADREVHSLLQSIRALDQGAVALERGVARVNYADQQLHYAVFGGDQSSDRRREKIARQAHALETESRALAQWAGRFLGNSPQGTATAEALQKFAQEAKHFHASVEKGADVDHAKRDFAALDKGWHQAVEGLSALGRSQPYYLWRRAERVDQIHNNLHQSLGISDERRGIGHGE